MLSRTKIVSHIIVMVVCKLILTEVVVQRCSYNFRKFHRKTSVKSLAPATLLKKRLWHRCFPVNFAKFVRIPFLKNTSGRLLLMWKEFFHVKWEFIFGVLLMYIINHLLHICVISITSIISLQTLCKSPSARQHGLLSENIVDMH